jgi:drug/metabolite transporter (DMT)-like permease/nitroimidazol reductase NimA-like FMN-containing flavoprotein (pyridoxamine 5'-phosphate oxidase superfamily)
MKEQSSATAGVTVPLPALAWASLGVLAFSGTFPATAFALRGFDPYVVGAGRSVVGALAAALALLALRAPLPSRDQLPALAAVAAGCGIGFGLLSAVALSRTTSTHAAVVTGLLPVATATVAVVRGGERPRPLFWLACLTGSAAVVAYALSRGAGRLQGGDVLLLLALVAAAIGYAEGGRLARSMPGWRVVAWGLIGALPVSLPVTILALHAHAPHPGPDALAGLAYVSLISVFLGFFAWYRGLARAGVARASQVQLGQPLLTIAWSALLLHEHADAAALVTAGVVIACVVVTQRSRGGVAPAAVGSGLRARGGGLAAGGGLPPMRGGAPAYTAGGTPAGPRLASAALPAPGATERTRVHRHAERALTTRDALHAVLDAGLVAHVSFVADGESVLLPLAYARRGDELLLHGSRHNRLLDALAGGAPLCAAVTIIDGLVLGATAFSHSMNYRSAVIYGRAREISDPGAKAEALDHFVDFLVPGRSGELRAHSAGELEATLVLAVPLRETSVKSRQGPPRAVPNRDGTAPWTGVIPIELARRAPLPS